MKEGKKLISADGYECEHTLSDILLEVSGIMHKKNKGSYWYVRMENFGWQRKNGFQYVEANIGKHLMSKILPNTQCSWNIFNYGKGIVIQNFHHDSNSGDEKYYCMPISKKAYTNSSYKGKA